MSEAQRQTPGSELEPGVAERCWSVEYGTRDLTEAIAALGGRSRLRCANTRAAPCCMVLHPCDHHARLAAPGRERGLRSGQPADPTGNRRCQEQVSLGGVLELAACMASEAHSSSTAPRRIAAATPTRSSCPLRTGRLGSAASVAAGATARHGISPRRTTWPQRGPTRSVPTARGGADRSRRC